MAQEGSSLGEMRHSTEEAEPTIMVEREKPGQEQAAEERAKHAHWQEERRASGDPALSVERDAAARYDHVNVRMVGEC